MSTITTTNPATGTTDDTGIEATTDAQVAEITAAAASAFHALRTESRAWGAWLVRALAEGREDFGGTVTGSS